MALGDQIVGRLPQSHLVIDAEPGAFERVDATYELDRQDALEHGERFRMRICRSDKHDAGGAGLDQALQLAAFEVAVTPSLTASTSW